MIQEKIKFRYDINALRAIAVAGVLLFHYRIKYFSGGFAGVDIFFVISGYLMTRIILNGINKNTFSFKDFYSRRLKRIVPALLCLVIVLTLVGFFIYFPTDYRLNEKNASSSLLFVSNIFYLKNSNYFDAASESNILLHTWSLSVEWQFYLLYPLILLVFNKLIKRQLIYTLTFISITIAILITSIIVTKYYPTASFYLLPTRSWEMLFGGIAFLVEDRVRTQVYSKYIAICGYILILISFLFLKNEMAWPGIFTFLPVFATFLIITSNYNSIKVLQTTGVQFIGKISYSLYLWHWPVYVIAQYMGMKLTAASVLMLITISLILAYLSYRYVESVDFKKSKLIIVNMAICLLLTSILTYLNVNKIVFKQQSLDLANYKIKHATDIDKQFNEDGCFITSGNVGLNAFNKQLCLNIEKDKSNILLIGDSHAADLSGSLREALKKRKINLIQATASGCYPVLNSRGASRCTELINYIYYDFIANNAGKIDGVILSANWFSTGKNNPNGLLDDITETISYLRNRHLKTILIGQNEAYSIPYASIVAKEFEYQAKMRNNYLNMDSYNINDFLQSKLAPYYVDIYNLNSFPKLGPANIPYMFDENHFTKYGADLTIEKVLSNSITLRFIKKGLNN